MERDSAVRPAPPMMHRRSISSCVLRNVLAGSLFGFLATVCLTIATLLMVTSEGTELGDIVWPQYVLMAAWGHFAPMSLLGIALAVAVTTIRGLASRLRISKVARRAG